MNTYLMKEAKSFASSGAIAMGYGIVSGIVFYTVAVVIGASGVVQHIYGLEALFAIFGFVLGGMWQAKRSLNASRRKKRRCSIGRVWVWPFLVFAWSSVAFANPFLLLLGVMSEGFIAAYYGADKAA